MGGDAAGRAGREEIFRPNVTGRVVRRFLRERGESTRGVANALRLGRQDTINARGRIGRTQRGRVRMTVNRVRRAANRRR